MAGPFTHWVITEKAMERCQELDANLDQILAQNAKFVLLGAVSPDLPYLSFNQTTTNWADEMHYHSTNGVVVHGYSDLKQRGIEDLETKALFSWLLGYASHMIADATIHPIVEKIVGEYQYNTQEHRECEMVQDILTFKHNFNQDIVEAEYTETIEFCRRSPHKNALFSFWQTQLRRTHPSLGDPVPAFWFDTYAEAIDLADGSNVLFKLFRHVGFGESFLYESSKELSENAPNNVDKYYENIALPMGGIGYFEVDGISRAVENVVQAWQDMFVNLKNQYNVADLILDWNLDTGKVNGGSNVATYWQNA